MPTSLPSATTWWYCNYVAGPKFCRTGATLGASLYMHIPEPPLPCPLQSCRLSGSDLYPRTIYTTKQLGSGQDRHLPLLSRYCLPLSATSHHLLLQAVNSMGLSHLTQFHWSQFPWTQFYPRCLFPTLYKLQPQTTVDFHTTTILDILISTKSQNCFLQLCLGQTPPLSPWSWAYIPKTHLFQHPSSSP